MLEWVRDHVWWLGPVSVVTFVGTLVAIPVLVVRMPHDYFAHPEPPPESWRGQHPVIVLAVLALKNLLGAVLVVAGIVMLVTPGQGILTMAIGLSLLDFPGKRRLELALVRRKTVLRAINWMRRRAHRPPLELPAPR